MAAFAPPKRIKIVITDHTIGPRDCVVLNRELDPTHVKAGRAPVLERGDAVDMDETTALEIIGNDRAFPVALDKSGKPTAEAQALVDEFMSQVAEERVAADKAAAAAAKGKRPARPEAQE